MKTILQEHGRRYPQMEAQDAVKLCYQASFGGGHLLSDPAAARRFLAEERQGLKPDAALPLTEEIGYRMVRVQLASPDAKALSDDVIFRIFSASSARILQREGNGERFRAALAELTVQTDAGDMPFAAEDLASYLQVYREQGCPAVSHTARYRSAYHPAYRVTEAVYPALLPVILRLDALLAAHPGRPVLAAIDGPAGSGKTTAAEALSALYNCTVFSMDDFFLPFSMRTEQRLCTPGGNVHYERFQKEVLAPLQKGQTAVYRPFDCRTGDFSAPVSRTPARLCLVEGSYSHHPALRDAYDIRICLRISPDVQKQRILARNGKAGLAAFAGRWIPMETAYFEAYDIFGTADLTVSI